MELVASILSVFLEQYRTRKMLKRTKIMSMGIDGSTRDGYKKLVEAHKKTKEQLVLRQVFGVLGGRNCEVKWTEKEIIVNVIL